MSPDVALGGQGGPVVHVYTGDQGALGPGYMWVYLDAPDAVEPFPLVFEGVIPSGDSWNIEWISRSEFRVKHLTQRRLGTETIVSLDDVLRPERAPSD